MPKIVALCFMKSQLKIESPIIFSQYFFGLSLYFIEYYRTLHLAITSLILIVKLIII